MQPEPGVVHARHERLTVAAAAIATLAVIAGPQVGGALAGRLVVDEARSYARDSLTVRARRALDGLPGAYQVGTSVVVPAAADPAVPPGDLIDVDQAVGELVPLGVDGLEPYVDVRAGRLPAWLEQLSDDEHVYAAMGPLVAGCLVEAGTDTCALGLFVRDFQEYTVLKRRLGSRAFLNPGSGPETFRVDVVGGQLVIGGMPGGSDRLEVRIETRAGDTVPGTTNVDVAPGNTIWWAKVEADPVELTVRDDERLVSRVTWR